MLQRIKNLKLKKTSTNDLDTTDFENEDGNQDSAGENAASGLIMPGFFTPASSGAPTVETSREYHFQKRMRGQEESDTSDDANAFLLMPGL